MRIEIRGKGVEITRGLREFVERRARFVLGRRSGQIERVQVWLEDVNGPKGGNDKRCRVQLRGGEFGDHVVEASAAELGTAVYEAMERSSRLAGRVLDRLRERSLGATRPWLEAS